MIRIEFTRFDSLIDLLFIRITTKLEDLPDL